MRSQTYLVPSSNIPKSDIGILNSRDLEVIAKRGILDFLALLKVSFYHQVVEKKSFSWSLSPQY